MHQCTLLCIAVGRKPSGNNTEIRRSSIKSYLIGILVYFHKYHRKYFYHAFFLLSSFPAFLLWLRTFQTTTTYKLSCVMTKPLSIRNAGTINNPSSSSLPSFVFESLVVVVSLFNGTVDNPRQS